MQRIVATLTIAVTLILAAGSVEVSGQVSCTFVGGFATLREQVGTQKVGECLEDEHFSAENGDTEQRTTGGLLVWRKADNFTVFTDGGTTWMNGPNGLQSRPNGERFSWETEPVAVAPSSSSDSPTATPTPSANMSPVVLASSPGPLSAGPLSAGDSLPQSPVAAASPAAASPTATVPAPTRTPTPTPAVRAKLTEKPDNVDTGSDARFEVETDAKKGTCTLVVGYRNTKDATVSSVEIDDGRCEMEYTIPEDTRTGKAKAKAHRQLEPGDGHHRRRVRRE